MPITLTALSGSRRNDVLEFDRSPVSIGCAENDDFRFDKEVDSEIVGQSIQLRLENEKWLLVSNARKPLFVNQTIVDRPTELKSGDIIRMSYDGPDLLFENSHTRSQPRTLPHQNNATSPTASSAQTQEPPRGGDKGFSTAEKPQKQEPGPALSQSDIAADEHQWFPRKALVVALPAVAIIGLCVVVGLMWAPRNNDKSNIEAREQQTELDELDERQRNASSKNDTSSFAETAPNVDRSSRPSPSRPLSNPDVASPYEQTVVINPVSVQNIDLSEGNNFSFRIVTTPPISSGSPLAFSLTPGAPTEARIAPTTGEITWRIPIDHPAANVRIPFQLTDTTNGRQVAQGEITISVKPADAWTIIESQVADCIYLLAAQPLIGNATKSDMQNSATLALGTGIAIDANHLLTSATVANALAEARSKDWKIIAYQHNEANEQQPRQHILKDLYVHSIYNGSKSLVDTTERQLNQAYFDLAIITIEGETQLPCKLSIVSYPLTDETEVAIAGFPVDGTLKLESAENKPFFNRMKLLSAIPLTGEENSVERPPLLLQLAGSTESTPFGSIIINKEGNVIGVYGFLGDLPADYVGDSVHYAAEVTQCLLYLSGKGVDFWEILDDATPALDEQ